MSDFVDLFKTIRINTTTLDVIIIRYRKLTHHAPSPPPENKKKPRNAPRPRKIPSLATSLISGRLISPCSPWQKSDPLITQQLPPSDNTALYLTFLSLLSRQENEQAAREWTERRRAETRRYEAEVHGLQEEIKRRRAALEVLQSEVRIIV